MSNTPDYSTWMTKQQAADSLAVSSKQIERWANDKRLQCAKWKRPEGGPTIAVYHPADVERIAHDRNPDAEPFVLSAAADRKPMNGTPAIAVRQPSAEQFLQAVAAAVSGASQTSQTHGGGRLAERLYPTIGEAAEYTGLGVGYLRRLITERKLELVKGAGPHRADVLPRADLEKLKL
jgi:excisionase family DNA binding protein